MAKALKNIGFFLVTITITAVIFWLVFLDKESKTDVFDYSLNLLGQRLMAMVPDKLDRSSVKKLYDNFVKQAAAKEVAPEQVEYVAANIFNLSNLDTILTAEQAAAVLKFSLQAPLKLERNTGSSESSVLSADNASVVSGEASHAAKEIPQKRWDELGIRIQELNKMNDELNIAFRDHPKEFPENHLQLHYRIDEGLKITLDPQVKAKLHHKKYRHLSRKMRKMEEKHLLEWRKDFRKEMEKMKHELHDLGELKKLEDLKKLKQLKQLKVMGSLEALKSLEGLEFILPEINADSIQAIVNASLEEAGVIKNDSL